MVTVDPGGTISSINVVEDVVGPLDAVGGE